MSFGHALYYPHINLTNKNWVKHALLFWDTISRIVPQSLIPEDSNDIIKIKEESGFIVDYHPQDEDTTGAFMDFSHELGTLMESDSFINDWHFNRERTGMGRFERHSSERFFLDSIQSTTTYIHVEKLSKELKEFFFESGIAVPGQYSYEDYIKIDSKIGLLYMTYLAKTISKKKSLPIVTDLEESFSATIQFESIINSDYRHTFEYKLGNLLIDIVVPKNINDIPFEKLLTVRKKYTDERIAFFKSISDLSDSIPAIDNDSAMADALNQHSKLIIKETKNLEKLYNIHKIETINKFLSISLPSTLVSFSEHIPDVYKPLIAVSGILFGLVSAASNVKKEKLELNLNPKSYLLNLQSELSGNDLFNKINDTVKGVRKW